MSRVRDRGLTLLFGALFFLALVGEAFAGAADQTNQRLADGADPVSLWQYVTSSSFAADVAENWQSEYLQFFLYILATVWFIQRGSSESKEPGSEGRESDEEQKVGRYATAESPELARVGGFRTALYSRSLSLVMGLLFVLSWLSQAVAGRAAYNEQLMSSLRNPLSLSGYVTSADFWNRSLQNWQSELLAVASMVILSIHLRERGSPESKAVGSPHESTGGSD
jgi:hypothetical protein